MKKYLRIILRGEPRLWYDMEVAEDAAMPQLVAQLQMAGYILAPQFWIPWESVAHMCFIQVQDGGPSTGSGQVDFTKARMQ